MARVARRADHRVETVAPSRRWPPPIRARLPLARILPWVLPVVGLLAATGTVLALENSAAWSALSRTLASLDFDAGRTALIQAWLAALILAVTATLLTGRPWVSGLAAMLFTGATYVWPFGERLRREVPEIFGVKETFQPGVLWHNQAVMLGVALLAALMGAATADLLRRGIVGCGLSLWSLARTRRLGARHVASIAGGLVIGLTLLTALTMAAGTDPLLRYGPEHGVYVAPVISARPAPVAVDPAKPATTPEPMPAQGQLLDKSYHSDAMGEDRHFLIYLPPSYELRRSATRHYPVLFLLHGDPGRPADWVQFGATSVFDTGIATGVLPETILVMPDGNGHVTAATQWADRFDGRDRIEDALLELVEAVDLEYRTIPDRDHRLIAGLSSGAFGAANIAARHPDVFGIAMSFSGYFVATGPVFGGISTYIRVNSPYYLVQDQPSARSVRYILVVGNHDPYYLQANQAFADLLARLGVPHELDVLTGGHSADVWQTGLAVGMSRMAQSLSVTVRIPAGGATHRLE